MSEIQKPVVEQPVAAPAVEVTAPVVAPATEAKVEEPVTAEPTVEAAVEEAAAPVEAKKEFAGEGILGYKAPGGFIKKLAGFQKKFFWLGSEAVEPKNLSNYLRGEKPEVGNHNAAWSSQTGSGLLYFSKLASDKSHPAGILNLSEISDITEDGAEFVFHAHGLKHVFQAATVAEAAEWVAAIKAASTEAKASAETITSSEGYKEHHSNLVKPAVAAAVAAPVAAVVAKEEKAEDKKEEKKEEKAEKAIEEKKNRTKSRSASRKRNSIFGGFLNKKEEEKKETSEALPEDATTEATAPVEAAVTPVVAAPVEEPVAVTDAEATTTEEPKPTVNKRNSVFARFSSFTNKKPSESAPEVPAKDETTTAEPISAEAPVIPAVETEPTSPVAAAEITPAVEEPVVESKKENKAELKADKRKSSAPSVLFSKLRRTVKGKTSPKAEKAVVSEKTPVVEPKTEDIKTEETPAVAATEPIVPAPAATTTPVVAATA